MRILLVEDDARIARKVKAVLEEAGYVVVSVANGEDAWFEGETEDYDGAVLDLGLPRWMVSPFLRNGGRQAGTSPCSF
jgi:DNA-binding response OmpR family regulator